jgi:hypothetical protein
MCVGFIELKEAQYFEGGIYDIEENISANNQPVYWGEYLATKFTAHVPAAACSEGSKLIIALLLVWREEIKG